MLHQRKLFPQDLFLWGYLKSKVFQAKPGSLQELRSRAKDAIRNVNENMLTTVIINFCKKEDGCI